MEMEDLREETREVAETRMKKSLIIMEISETEDIRFDPQELENETIRTMEYYSRIMPEKEFKKLANQRATSSLIGNIMSDLIIENTKEYLRDIARGREPRKWTEEADEQTDLVSEPEIEGQAAIEPAYLVEIDNVSTSEDSSE